MHTTPRALLSYLITNAKNRSAIIEVANDWCESKQAQLVPTPKDLVSLWLIEFSTPEIEQGKDIFMINGPEVAKSLGLFLTIACQKHPALLFEVVGILTSLLETESTKYKFNKTKRTLSMLKIVPGFRVIMFAAFKSDLLLNFMVDLEVPVETDFLAMIANDHLDDEVFEEAYRVLDRMWHFMTNSSAIYSLFLTAMAQQKEIEFFGKTYINIDRVLVALLLSFFDYRIRSLFWRIQLDYPDRNAFLPLFRDQPVQEKYTQRLRALGYTTM